MNYYVVSYDLHKQRDYTTVIKALTDNKAVKLLESFWLLSTTATASEVLQWAKTFVDKDDSVAVIQIKQGSYWACINAKPDGATWLRTNILK